VNVLRYEISEASTLFSETTSYKNSSTSSMSKHLNRKHKKSLSRAHGGLAAEKKQSTLDSKLEEPVPVSKIVVNQPILNG